MNELVCLATTFINRDGANVSEILLENEQKQLLTALVEATRNVPSDQRKPFIFTKNLGGSEVQHPGLAGDENLKVYEGDMESLAREGLLSLLRKDRSLWMFDVSPHGFEYYEQMKQSVAQPLQGVENAIRNHLVAERFQQTYSVAYQKWADAEKMLWTSDSERQYTTIGHLCREALQEFATVLAERYQIAGVNNLDKAHTVKRIRAVLDLKKEQLGETEKKFLDALLPFWGTVSDLVQRQEHGGQREGLPLVWEDGRRVVFQTAVVMFEIDSSLSRTQ